MRQARQPYIVRKCSDMSRPNRQMCRVCRIVIGRVHVDGLACIKLCDAAQKLRMCHQAEASRWHADRGTISQSFAG